MKDKNNIKTTRIISPDYEMGVVCGTKNASISTSISSVVDDLSNKLNKIESDTFDKLSDIKDNEAYLIMMMRHINLNINTTGEIIESLNNDNKEVKDYIYRINDLVTDTSDKVYDMKLDLDIIEDKISEMKQLMSQLESSNRLIHNFLTELIARDKTTKIYLQLLSFIGIIGFSITFIFLLNI